MTRLLLAPLALAIAALSLPACVNDVEDEGGFMGQGAELGGSDVVEEALTATCAQNGSRLKGIDISYWQGNIDWQRVKDDGVVFAFIRVSDGTGHSDSKFSRNWSEAKAKGIRRGAYQFFRSNQDPIAQADLLIDALGGALEPGDLPPVIDVETTDGQRSATIKAKVETWLAHVEDRLGVKPIIYTAPYFWRDQVGSTSTAANPLWIAHWGTNCPLTPSPWSEWTFHQYADNGRVAGVTGNVDMDWFDGTLEQLDALGFGNALPPPDPVQQGCDAIGAAGGVVDEESACFTPGGPSQYLHAVATGHNGGSITTGTTDHQNEVNFGEWALSFAQEGDFEVRAYVERGTATSRQTKYKVTHADGTRVVAVNQASATGFVSLGVFHFRAGNQGYKVHVGDNTGEAGSLNRDLVLDAIEVRPGSLAPPPAASCPRVQVVTDGTALNLRPQPNTNRAPLSALQNGTVVDRLDTVQGQAINGNTTWYQVRRSASVTGFVTAAYVRCVQ